MRGWGMVRLGSLSIRAGGDALPCGSPLNGGGELPQVRHEFLDDPLRRGRARRHAGDALAGDHARLEVTPAFQVMGRYAVAFAQAGELAGVGGLPAPQDEHHVHLARELNLAQDAVRLVGL